MAKLNRQEDFPHHEERNGKLSWKYCHVFQMLNFGHKLFCHLSFKDKRMLKTADQFARCIRYGQCYWSSKEMFDLKFIELVKESITKIENFLWLLLHHSESRHFQFWMAS